MRIVEVRHPLIRHKLGLMRRADISTKEFRKLAGEVAAMLTYEATSDLETIDESIPGWAGDPVPVQRIKGLFLVAAPEGLKNIEAAHSDIEIYTAAIDDRLNEKGYILPGLGDAGDKIFGTRQLPSDD